MTGRLVACVGPSGVGKDSVMAGLADRDPEIRIVKRVITRAPELGGEDYTHASEDAFHKMEDDGAFCLSWGAHGLFYGIPKQVADEVAAGQIRLVNLSRNILGKANAAFPGFLVINLTASPETLAERLSGRGRETAEEIAARLARRPSEWREGLNVVDVSNDGALEDAVSAAYAALRPVKA